MSLENSVLHRNLFFFREHIKDIWNCSYTELQVQGCSVKGDIRCCKVERDNEVESPAEFEKH